MSPPFVVRSRRLRADCGARALAERWAGFGGAQENRRDLLDLVKFARSDLHDQVVGLVISERQAAAVQAGEGDHRGQAQPLVAIDQGVVASQRVQQGGRLGIPVSVSAVEPFG